MGGSDPRRGRLDLRTGVAPEFFGGFFFLGRGSSPCTLAEVKVPASRFPQAESQVAVGFSGGFFLFTARMKVGR